MAKKIFRVFLDSNIILSGLLSDKGVPRTILDILSIGFPFLIGSTGKYNLMEIERNLKKKLPALSSVYKKYLPKLSLKIIPLPRPEEIRQFSGQVADKDVPVLVSASQGRADFLVTGDKQLFGKYKVPGEYPLRIISPSEFLDLILPEIIREVEKMD